MDGIFDNILENLTIVTEKAKAQVDKLLIEAEKNTDEESLKKLKNHYSSIEKAINEKNIDELQKILKDAY
jgi:hypothetical protein